MTRGERRGRTGLFLRIAISIGLLGGLLWLLPWSEVREAIGSMPIPVWLAILGLFLVGHRLGVAKWGLLLAAGGAPLARRDAIRCYAAGLFTNLCLPSIVGGDVLRAALAARSTGRTEAAVLGGVADRLIDVLTLGLCLAGGAFVSARLLPGRLPLAVAAVAVAGVLGLVVVVRLVASRPVRRWPRRVRRPLARSLVALRRLRRAPGTALLAAGLSLAIQAGFVLLNAWIGRSLGIEIPLSVWFVAWPLAKLVALMPISLGGLGVRDAAFGALLVPLGVPLARGVVASLVWQSILIGGGLLAGAAWLALGRGANEREPSGIAANPPVTPPSRA